MIKKILFLSSTFLSVFIFCFFLEAQSVTAIFRISLNIFGRGSNQGSRNTSLSPNSELLVFESNSTDLVSFDTNQKKDIFVRNLKTNQTIRVNLGRNGEEANGNSQLASISAKAVNGLYAIVYESSATNLVRFDILPDNNDKQDIFISIPGVNSTDIAFTERVSLGSGPLGFGIRQADGDSFKPSVAAVQNPDRVLVAYSSDATNLIDADLNGKRDVFLATFLRPEDFNNFDPRTMASAIRVSNNAAIGESNGDSDNAAISANGKFVVYESDSTNLVNGISQAIRQIYLYSIDDGSTTLISKSATGIPGNKISVSPAINYDGQFITYLTKATNIIGDSLIPNSQTYQVIHYNVRTGLSSRVNISTSGELGNSTSDTDMSAKLSPDGRFVTFSDSSSNLAENDFNSNTDIFVRDMQTGSLQLVTRALSGISATGQSTVPVLGALSFNASTAILPFTTTAADLISDDTEGQTDAYVSQVTIPSLPLTKNEGINIPADITVSGKNAIATLKTYKGAQLKTNTRSLKLRLNSIRERAKKSRKLKIQYLIRTFEDDPNKAKKKLVKQLTSKRNVITIKNLKPGNYISNYQARIIEGNKIKGKSQFSPDQKFSIN